MWKLPEQKHQESRSGVDVLPYAPRQKSFHNFSEILWEFKKVLLFYFIEMSQLLLSKRVTQYCNFLLKHLYCQTRTLNKIKLFSFGVRQLWAIRQTPCYKTEIFLYVCIFPPKGSTSIERQQRFKETERRKYQGESLSTTFQAQSMHAFFLFYHIQSHVVWSFKNILPCLP